MTEDLIVGDELERLAVIALMALVFAPLELLFPAVKRPQGRFQRYRTDILHILIGGYVIRLATIGILGWLITLLAIPRLGAALPLWLQVIAILLMSDLAFYTMHRIYHAVPTLWRFHRIHHSSEHLDWLAAYRVHPVDQGVNATIIALPAFAVGFSPLALLIYATVYQWHSILLHSNIGWTFGPVGRWVTSPRFHHWHHANDPAAFNKNFGGQLTLWDRLFGTALERDHEPPQCGIENPPNESFLAHMITPFTDRTNHGQPDQIL